MGFIVDLKGRKSHQIVRDGLTALDNLNHRGACGCENNTGDGAGILIQIPHEFLRRRAAGRWGSRCPSPSITASGAFFTSPDRVAAEVRHGALRADRRRGRAGLPGLAADRDRRLARWARGPGRSSRSCGTPSSAAARRSPTPTRFERKLYVIRKRFENEIEDSGLDDHKYFYFSSLSCRTLVYKGMLTTEQLGLYFADDLGDPLLHERPVHVPLAVQHQHVPELAARPSLSHDLAQRRDQHLARQYQLDEGARGAVRLGPLRAGRRRQDHADHPRGALSDTACLDNAVELLVRSGYSLPHAMMMLIPEAWENHESMSQAKKDFYRYHSCLMEPWDGPASVDVHRRQVDRRRARPQRPAAQPLCRSPTTAG